MVYESALANAALNTASGLDAAKALYNRSSTYDSVDCACRYILIPKGLSAGPGVEWSLSAWVSIHGTAYSYAQQLMVVTGKNALGGDSSFDYKNNSRVTASHGVIFSDYSGYSGGRANANFSINEKSVWERYGGFG